MRVSLINDEQWKTERSWIYSVLQTALVVHLVKRVINNTSSFVTQRVDLRFNS